VAPPSDPIKYESRDAGGLQLSVDRDRHNARSLLLALACRATPSISTATGTVSACSRSLTGPCVDPPHAHAPRTRNEVGLRALCRRRQCLQKWGVETSMNALGLTMVWCVVCWLPAEPTLICEPFLCHECYAKLHLGNL
jgi:hypothetical protein